MDCRATYDAASLILVGEECKGKEGKGPENVDRDGKIVAGECPVSHAVKNRRQECPETVGQDILAELGPSTNTPLVCS